MSTETAIRIFMSCESLVFSKGFETSCLIAFPFRFGGRSEEEGDNDGGDGIVDLLFVVLYTQT